jgi:dipeptidyl aminopeptidase/acylaminoacyl peptidase
MAVLGTFVAAAGANFPGRNGVIAFQGFGGISTIDPSTGAVREIISGGARPAWSADGTRLAFMRTGIWVANANGGKQTRLTSSTYNDRDPAWSPSGKRITFERDGSIWVMQSNGKGQTALTAPGRQPSWSPDGRRIAFYGDDRSAYTMNSDGTDRRLLASEMQFGETSSFLPTNPDWSPDGQQVVLEYVYLDQACDGCQRLVRVPAEGGEGVEMPASFSDFFGGPSWSPDGTEIVAHNYTGLTTFSVGVNAISRALLAGEGWPAQFPSWQPLPVRSRHP